MRDPLQWPPPTRTCADRTGAARAGGEQAAAYRCMIVPHDRLARTREGFAPLPDASPAPTTNRLTDRPDGADAVFSVGWRLRLRFTRRSLDPANHTLRDVIEAEPGLGAARVLTVIDDGLVRAGGGPADAIEHYAGQHRDRIQLASAPLVVPGGESAKNDRAVFDHVAQAIHDAGLCRRSYVLAIGGGAVLDVAGFAAATAHRGVRLIRMPTTTLAQDDSGVGVKNGVNAFGKKNFLGAFAPPWAVIVDPDFLLTLSDRDWASGWSECVKVALVKDASFFEAIESAAEALRRRDLDTAATIIRRSARLHLAHIAAGGDPFELTRARPLDFGHWAAHKLEQITGFRLRHGEAVSIGVALDATYSTLSGWLSEADRERILACLRALGLPTFDEALGRDALLEGLEEFREHLGGRLTVPMLRGLGIAFDVHAVDHALMREAVARLGDEAAGRGSP